jgi:hypothetical protein
LNEFLSKLQVNYELLEASVSHKAGSYFGLNSSALLTDLSDYLSIFHYFSNTDHFVEFGSAYGFGPLIFSHLYPTSRSTGIEFEEVRYNKALELKESLGLENTHFIQDDLLTAQIPEADLYFLYFPTGMILDRILFELSHFNHSFRIVVIESHGDLLARFQMETWLSEEFEIPLKSPRHYPAAKVFSSGGVKTPSVFDFSFKTNYFLIRELLDHHWIGDSYGFEWHSEDRINLIHPPLTIELNQITDILNESDIQHDLLKLLQLRAMGEVKVVTSARTYQAFIRKIYLIPRLMFEMSTGERLNYDQVLLIDSI